MGGTCETKPLASALADAGFHVLVSTATGVKLDIGKHCNITRRSGHLNAKALVRLIAVKCIQLVIDATHPYAVAAHNQIQEAASAAGVPLLRYDRPDAVLDKNLRKNVITAKDHAGAARKAFAFGLPVLLTTGSTHLKPYTHLAKARKIPLAVRVLNHQASIIACISAGILRKNIITGRGPFSCTATRKHIRVIKAGVMVTKDSGLEGGLAEKIRAAALEGCKVVLISRPPSDRKASCKTVQKLVDAVIGELR